MQSPTQVCGAELTGFARAGKWLRQSVKRVMASEQAKEALYAYLYFWARVVLLVHRPRIIGITGTVGKTTTTGCIGTVLMHRDARSRLGIVKYTIRNMNDNTGLPLTVLGYENWPQSRREWARVLACLPFRAVALALAPRAYPNTLVLEYGAGWGSDVGRLARLARPSVAVVTSVGPAHLERFGTVEGVAREKCELVCAIPPQGLVVLGEDNDFMSMMEQRSPAPVIKVAGRGRLLSERIAHKVGEHFGLHSAAISEALRSYTGADGRLQLRELGFVKLIDDVFNANPLSMRLALDTLDGAAAAGQRKVAVLGGMGELGEHSAHYHAEIAHYARERADMIVGVGALAKAYQADFWFTDSEECANHLHDWVRPNDCVLMKGSHSVYLRRVVKQLTRIALDHSATSLAEVRDQPALAAAKQSAGSQA
jgi:UDP-N-acetylmuramyl pentapeptide synthase